MVILSLVGGYFLLWAGGPLWLSQSGTWLGMPMWFWGSCVAAPVALLGALLLLCQQQDKS
ncbi:hypothetical protein KU855_07730 [Shewanella sp. NIFS-20-20]|nr:hypothetical protein [Shewanella sp. NIFS-20-20]